MESMEPMEPRRMLAVVTVNTDQDIVDPSDQFTSLREAIRLTNDLKGADEIVFHFDHDGSATIQLEHGELELTDAVTIAGPGREWLTLDAQHHSRIFNITAKDGDFVFQGLTLTGARGVYRHDDPYVGVASRSDSAGQLTLRNSAIKETLLAHPERCERSFEKLVILQSTEANRVYNASNRRKRREQSSGLVTSVTR
jgi:hypothetical protein